MIRYPRGRGVKVDIKPYEKISIGKAKCLAHGTETAVLSNGPIGKNVSLALANLGQPKISLMTLLFVKPLDEKSYTTYLKHLKNYNS
jgi:1-deoxy-D-xylulose-5-phosphate synthase